jgi:hypothetical protein
MVITLELHEKSAASKVRKIYFDDVFIARKAWLVHARRTYGKTGLKLMCEDVLSRSAYNENERGVTCYRTYR